MRNSHLKTVRKLWTECVYLFLIPDMAYLLKGPQFSENVLRSGSCDGEGVGYYC